MNKFMRVCEWIYRLLFLNSLWLLFTLGGLIVLGIFPSTVAMFYITKEWLGGNTDQPIFKTFFTKFKEEFLRSQLFGAVLLVIGALLYFDIQFFFQKEGMVFYLMRYVMLMIGFLYMIMLPFVFPLFVQQKLTLGVFLKNVLIISITRIFHSVIMVIGCFTIFVVFAKFAGLFIFFLGSTVAFWLTWNSTIAMKKIRFKLAVSR